MNLSTAQMHTLLQQQAEHDNMQHTDVSQKTSNTQQEHFFKHYTKYSGRLCAIHMQLHSSEESLKLIKDTLVDSLLITLSFANTRNYVLPQMIITNSFKVSHLDLLKMNQPDNQYHFSINSENSVHKLIQSYPLIIGVIGAAYDKLYHGEKHQEANDIINQSLANLFLLCHTCLSLMGFNVTELITAKYHYIRAKKLLSIYRHSSPV